MPSDNGFKTKIRALVKIMDLFIIKYTILKNRMLKYEELTHILIFDFSCK